MSGINEVREAAVQPRSAGGGGVLGILIGLSVGVIAILIGLLLFMPPMTAMSFFDRGNEDAFQQQYCPSLVGGEGELLPAVNRAGEGELLPAVNKGEDGGMQACGGIFSSVQGGDMQLMSFFACQGSFRRSVALPPMNFETFCMRPITANSWCFKECDPDQTIACGGGLTCTSENGSYVCDGAICHPGQYGGKCNEKCDPAAANACQPGLDCKPAGSSFTCQGPSCSQPTAVVTQPPVSTEPANPNGQPTPECTPNPNDRTCSACENTDLDFINCECKMDGVCGPGEGFNCGDCMPTAVPGDNGGGKGKCVCDVKDPQTGKCVQGHNSSTNQACLP